MCVRVAGGGGVDGPITVARPRDHDNNKADEFAGWGQSWNPRTHQ